VIEEPPDDELEGEPRARRQDSPHNLDAERSVLGACLLRAAAADEVRDTLAAEDFYRDAHRRIFRAIAHLRSKTPPVAPDFVTLRDRLQQTGELDDCGGLSYITRLIDGVPRATNVEHYAGIVRRFAVVREVLTLGQQAVAGALDPNAEPEALLEALQAGVLRASTRQGAERDFETMEQLLGDFLEHVEAVESGSTRVVTPTGFVELDYQTDGGLRPGLALLAARTSHGKTALAANLAISAAQSGAGQVAFYSLEQNRVEVRERLLAMLSRIDASALRRCNLTGDQWRRVQAGMGRLEPLPIRLYTGPATLSMLRAMTRRLRAAGPIALVIVDYLQRVDMPARSRNDTREAELGRLARSLQELGHEVGAPVLALAQLSRETEKRGGKPQLSDLRESGSLEQDADLVLLLHRPSMHDPQEPKDLAILNIAKQRQGPLGTVRLRFTGASFTFEDWDRGTDPGALDQQTLLEEPTR
jgi:replicative DNA helicase